jgi:hypothetical protein
MNQNNTVAALFAASAIVATVAPTEARAQDPASVALAGQITVVIDGMLSGHPSGVALTPAQIRQAEMAIKGLVTGALGSGMTYEQIAWAASRGVGKSVAGQMGLRLGNWITIVVHDTWSAASSTLGALSRIPLPLPLIYIITDPGTTSGEIMPDMAHVWSPFDHDYYSHDYGDAEDEGGTAWAGGGFGNGQGGDYEPGGERPRTKYDSSEHEDGYWTSAGCFPPVPDVHHWSTVPCTGNEAPAPMMLVPVIGPGDAVVGSAWVSTIPLGSHAEALLLLPEVQTMTPTVVHWF